MSYKKKEVIVHNIPKQTPQHKLTTQHTTTPDHLGEEFSRVQLTFGNWPDYRGNQPGSVAKKKKSSVTPL
jgi:hypothetical protein